MNRDGDDHFPRSLGDFSVDLLLSSCCLMLNAIANEEDNKRRHVLDEILKFPLPTDVPPSMAARYYFLISRHTVPQIACYAMKSTTSIRL